jgi:phage antirepressor YoqD-like protein
MPFREAVLAPLDMGVNQFAKALKVDAARLNEIVRDRLLSRNKRRILDWTSGRLRIETGAPIETEAY